VKQISVREAKTHFSAVVKDIEAGEIIVVTRRGKPVIEMRSVDSHPVSQVSGISDSNPQDQAVDWTDLEVDELYGELISANISLR